MPTVTPIRVCELTYPAGHPDGAGPGDLYVFLVRSGSSTFLVDTGVGAGNAAIDAHYRPRRVDLIGALGEQGVAPGTLDAVVCTHLHFDHCGNNGLFAGLPIFVHRAEYEAAQGPRYTVNEWLHFEGARYHLLDGPLELTHEVSIVPTPGHTAGHQSVAVATAAGLHLVVGQAAYTAAEFESYRTATPQARDDAWSMKAYAESLYALHRLAPRWAYFSHDSTVWCDLEKSL